LRGCSLAGISGEFNEISNAIRELDQKADVRQKLSLGGLRRAKDFDWERSADIVRKVYLGHFGVATEWLLSETDEASDLRSRGIPARYGGFETFAEQLAVRLVERGHEVTVFCEAGEVQVRIQGRKARQRASPNFVADDRDLRRGLFMAGAVQVRRGLHARYGSSALCWLPRNVGSQC